MESNEHKLEKKLIDRCMSELGFVTLGYEIGRRDILFCADTWDIIVENERSARNALRNVEQGLARADGVLTIPSSFAVMREIAHKFHKHLPPEHWPRVGLLNIAALLMLSGQARKTK